MTGLPKQKDCFTVWSELANEKLGNIPTWQGYEFTSVIGGMTVKGCLTSIKTRGPDKGGVKYLMTGRETVFLSTAELKAASDK